MNRRIKKKKAKHPRGYIILSSPKNNTPEWKRYKTRIKLSKRYTVEIRNKYAYEPLIPSLSDVMHWMEGLPTFNKEDQINE